MTEAIDARRWLIYACRTDYTAEVLEILNRCGDRLEVLVDNLVDGSPEPTGAVIPSDRRTEWRK
jgi:hypothetical protein